ncbi:MAG: TIGR00153 family protein [Legionellales bacterium]|nr:TIGR00153 family protein [Legionellales bacterium]
MKSPMLNLFGRSPIKPLQKHMSTAFKCAQHLIPFFNAVFAGDWENASHIRDEISKLEKEADDMKKDIRLHLPKGLFLPVPRTDLLEVLSMQDRLANRAKDITGIVVGRKLLLPDNLKKLYQQFLARCIDAAAQAHKAINELDELLETGFKGIEVKLVEEMIVELHQIEHDTDEMQIEIRKILFAQEDTLNPVTVIFLYKLIEWTGDLADRAENVGGQLLLLLAR